MKNKLSRLENNYYYGISRYFWHFVIGLAVLGVVAGIAVYLWSQIPVSKNEVVKSAQPQRAEFPTPKNVSINSILNALPKTVNDHNINIGPEPIEDDAPVDYPEEIKTIDSLAIRRFNDEIDITKKLISEKGNDNFWKDSGVYTFASDRDRKMYKKTHNPKLRHFELTTKGFKKRLIKYTNKQGLKSYDEKTELLASINLLLSNVDSLNRKSLIIRKLLSTKVNKLGLSKTKSIYKEIGNIISKINKKQQILAYKYLFEFSVKNRMDGLKLIQYEAKIIDSVTEKKFSFIKRIHREYTNNYNNNLISLTQATDQFIPYLSKLKPESQDLALKIFYRLYRKNNRDRNQKIKDIENNYTTALQNWETDYQNELANADSIYYAKKTNKSNLKSISIKSIMYGFVAVLIVSLLLLILSMIRNVNRLSEAMLDNNRLFQNSLTQTKSKEE